MGWYAKFMYKDIPPLYQGPTSKSRANALAKRYGGIVEWHWKRPDGEVWEWVA